MSRLRAVRRFDNSHADLAGRNRELLLFLIGHNTLPDSCSACFLTLVSILFHSRQIVKYPPPGITAPIASSRHIFPETLFSARALIIHPEPSYSFARSASSGIRAFSCHWPIFLKKEKSEVILDELVKIIKGLTPEKLCAALVAAALLGWAFVWKDQKKITRRDSSRAAYKRPCRFARHGRRFRVHPSAHIRPGSGAAPPARRRPEARSAAPFPAGRRIP